MDKSISICNTARDLWPGRPTIALKGARAGLPRDEEVSRLIHSRPSERSGRGESVKREPYQLSLLILEEPSSNVNILTPPGPA